jgi:tetratricopeptide (TPR) repeat protein
MAHANLSLVRMDRGELEQAEFHLQEALCEAESIGHNYTIANCCQNFCQLYNLSHSWEKALSFGERSLKIYEELGARQELATVYTLMGIAQLGLNQVDEAENWAQRAQELHAAADEESPQADTENYGRNLRLIGQIHLARNELEKAQAALEESSAVFNRLNNRIEFARSIAILASVDGHLGDSQRAATLRQKAQETFKRLGATLDLSRMEEPA